MMSVWLGPLFHFATMMGVWLVSDFHLATMMGVWLVIRLVLKIKHTYH